MRHMYILNEQDYQRKRSKGQKGEIGVRAAGLQVKEQQELRELLGLSSRAQRMEPKEREETRCSGSGWSARAADTR